MNYVPTIGLEVHVQLNTNTKLFCSCNTSFGVSPNTNICPVCLALPGSLPVINSKAVEKAIISGVSLNGKIRLDFSFDRKNYFYPDLPKGYQISQMYEPYCSGGFLTIENPDTKLSRKISIDHIHLEEDAGKLIHSEDDDILESYVDLNRAGTPLIEIVSKPDIDSPDEAYLYLTELKSILRYIDVSNCNMEEGSLRCDANISIKEKEATELGTKVEIKNLNSFKAVRSALEYEIERQKDMITSGKKILQETRLWDANAKKTLTMRSKEEALDYRYFPDLDLVEISISKEDLAKFKSNLPELPKARKERIIKQYHIPEYDASVLVSEKEIVDFFETTMQYQKISSKNVANWIMSELLAVQKQKNYLPLKEIISEKHFADLIYSIGSGDISGKIAKTVFQKVIDSGLSPKDIIKKENLVQITDSSSIQSIVDQAIKENPQSVNDYLAGKDRAIKALMGNIMKQTKGKANPKIVNETLLSTLSKLQK